MTTTTAQTTAAPTHAPAAPAKTATVAKPATAATAPKAQAPVLARPVAKAPAKPAAKKQPAPRPAKAAAAPAQEPAKDSKAKKPKLVRDSFTIPKDEYAVIETLKERCAALAQPIKKSELLRAGLKVLAAMSDSALRNAVQAVPSIKTGRPKADTAATQAPGTKPAAKRSRK